MGEKVVPIKQPPERQITEDEALVLLADFEQIRHAIGVVHRRLGRIDEAREAEIGGNLDRDQRLTSLEEKVKALESGVAPEPRRYRQHDERIIELITQISPLKVNSKFVADNLGLENAGPVGEMLVRLALAGRLQYEGSGRKKMYWVDKP